METPRPPHHQSPINIVIEGRLLAASPDKAPAPLPAWWKFWRGPPETVLARATWLLVIIAALQAWISVWVAKAALNEARENFRSEQRPIIWLTNDLSGPVFLRTEQIAWNWHYTNYGKTPALHITFRQFMKIEDSTEESSGAQAPLSGAPLPNGKVDFATVVSKRNINQSEFDRLLSSTDNPIGISGTISYSDAYGAKYETTFCLTRLTSGAIRYCKEGNDIRMVSAAQ